MLQYNPTQTTVGGNVVTVTVRATDLTGRFVDASFTVTRPDALSGTLVQPRAFQVRGLNAQVLTGPVDRFVVTFNSAVDATSLATTDFTVTDPQSNAVTVSQVKLITATQVLVTLGAYTTLLGGYAINVKPTISKVGGGELNQDRDGTAGETGTNPVVTDDHYLTSLYFAPGPRTRYEYDYAGRLARTIDPQGNATQYGYSQAGELQWIVDPLGRETFYGYDSVGRLARIAEPHLVANPPTATVDDGDAGFTPGTSWTAETGLGFGNDYYRFVLSGSPPEYLSSWNFSSDTYTHDNRYVVGKTYEVLVRWVTPSSVQPAATRAKYEIVDGTSVEATVFVNQQTHSPIHFSQTDANWLSLGHVTIDSSTFKVQLSNQANGNTYADAVRLVESSPLHNFQYDMADNLTKQIDPLGSVSEFVYDARNRATHAYQTNPATGAAGGPLTRYLYDAAGQPIGMIDPLGYKSDYIRDAMGRVVEAISPVADPTVTSLDTTNDTSTATGFSTKSDALAYGNTYKYFASGSGTPVATWNLSGLTAGKYYQVMASWVEDATLNITDAKYRVYGGTLNQSVRISQRRNPSDRFEPNPGGQTDKDAWWKGVMVFKAPASSVTMELSRGGADDGELVADAIRVIEVGPTTSFKYDAVGNVIEVLEPDLGGDIGRPETDLTHDKHYNLKKIDLPDPDGNTPTAYTRSTIQYAFDDLDRQIEQTDERGAKTAYKYDGLGRLTRLIEPNAATGLAESGGNPVGGVTQFEMDPRGNLVRITDAMGRVTQQLFDSLDRNFSSFDPFGSRDFVSFDGAGQVKAIVDKLGRATGYTLDNLGRVTAVTQADPDAAGPLGAPVYNYTYDVVGNRKQMTEPDPDAGGSLYASSVTDYTYDKLNRLTQVLRHDPDGASADQRPQIDYTYTAASELETITEKLGTGTITRTFKREYDRLGRLLKSIQPDATSGAATGPTTVYGFDPIGNRTSETLPDPDGGGTLLSPVTNWTFDALGRVSMQQLPDPDNIQGTTNPQDRPTSTYAYDAAGNAILVKTPDPSDADVTHWDNAVIETAFAYDYLGRRSSETRNDPDTTGPLTAQTTAYGYDLVGNLTKLTEPDPDGTGALTSPVTWNIYDAMNRATSTLDPREGATRYGYDATGNRTSLTDPVLNTTTWTYDRLNRMTVDMNTLGDARRYEYDAVGRLTAEIDRNGRATVYGYDPLNRRTHEKWFSTESAYRAAPDPKSSPRTTWNYDVGDRLEDIDDPAADYTYTYDRQDNVLLVKANIEGLAVNKNVFLRQTYDNLGRRKDSMASIGTIEDFIKDYLNTYTYDTLSRLTSISQDDRPTVTYNEVAEKRADFTYNALGQFQKLTGYSNVAGTTEVAHSDYQYDKFARLIGLDHEKSDNSILTGYDYTFDNLNRVKGVDFSTQIAGADYNSEDVTAYAYDATNQLTTADRTTGTDESFVHDLNGNRRMSGTVNWVVGANNQLTGDGTFTYQYDKEGNRTKRTKTSDSTYVDYAYDNRNRLTQAKTKSFLGAVTQQVDYVYDAYDRLVKRTFDEDGAGVTYAPVDEYFAYDGNDVALRFDGSGTLTKRYLNGPAADQVLAEEQIANGLASNDRTYWALTDHLGTVRDVINKVAALKKHLTYDAFGKITAETATAVDFLYGFTGLFRDEATGLFLTQTRWYDPGTGKWMHEDWIGFAGGDANLTRYVGNSPTLFTDPTGETWWNPYDWLASGLDSLYGTDTPTEPIRRPAEPPLGPPRTTDAGPADDDNAGGANPRGGRDAGDADISLRDLWDVFGPQNFYNGLIETLSTVGLYASGAMGDGLIIDRIVRDMQVRIAMRTWIRRSASTSSTPHAGSAARS